MVLFSLILKNCNRSVTVDFNTFAAIKIMSELTCCLLRSVGNLWKYLLFCIYVKRGCILLRFTIPAFLKLTKKTHFEQDTKRRLSFGKLWTSVVKTLLARADDVDDIKREVMVFYEYFSISIAFLRRSYCDFFSLFTITKSLSDELAILFISYLCWFIGNSVIGLKSIISEIITSISTFFVSNAIRTLIFVYIIKL